MSEQQDDKNILNDLFSVINKLILVMLLLIFVLIAIPIGYYISNLPERPKEVLNQKSLSRNTGLLLM